MNKLEIINAALRLIGTNEINALSDNTAEARVVSDIYNAVFYEALSSHPWAFLRKDSIALSKEPNESPDGKYVYPLPSDWLAIVKVYDDSTEAEVPYELSGNKILTDYLIPDGYSLYARYVKKPDEGELPLYFIPYFTALLASWLAIPLTENNSLAEYWTNRAQDLFYKAATADTASSGTKRLAQESEYTMISGR